MISSRPCRPFKQLSPLLPFCSHRHSVWTMSDRKAAETQKHNVKKEKRPPLTHFLCLPLVNSISLPQLETSLATFKSTIPCSSQPDHDIRPLIPEGAIRPIGTLHLTLGVMSLPTKERLDEALGFFHSLDLTAMIREAESIAKRPRKGKTVPNTNVDSASPIPNDRARSFSISLESLHSFPRAHTATVLHAAPVDPTSRLYPFCEMLLNKFIEAGFVKDQQNGANEQVQEQNTANSNIINHSSLEKTNDSVTACQDASIESQSLGELPVDLADNSVQQRSETSRTGKHLERQKPKGRPLVLHATIVNTIYIRGRPRTAGPKNSKRKNNQYKFDARGIVAHYRDYYLDDHRVTPRSEVISTGALPEADQDKSHSGSEDNGTIACNKGPNEKGKRMRSPNTRDTRKYPFVWAKDFPLETVCICEMGAKKLDTKDDEGNTIAINARLGEKYKVVSERSLDFEPVLNSESQPLHGQGLAEASSDASGEGGVQISV